MLAFWSSAKDIGACLFRLPAQCVPDRQFRVFAQAVDAGTWMERSSRRPFTSDSWNLRCPPGVRMDPRRPAAAHLVTVLGSTRNIRATSPGVSNRSWMSIVTRYLLLGPERCHSQGADPHSAASMRWRCAAKLCIHDDPGFLAGGP